MPSPTPAGTATFTIQSDWQAGFTGQVTVTNTGASTVTGWQIELDTIDQMTASWNGTVVSQSPGKYVVSNAAWNGSLAPGTSATFGFNLNRVPGNTGVSVHLTGLGGAGVVPPPLPVLQVTGASVNEGAAGSHQESFDVRLSAASTQTVTVQYATANGTALAGRDYDAATGQVTFAPGQTDQTILVATHPGAAGTNLLFSLAFSNAVGAILPAAAATGQIVNPAVVPPGVLSVNVSEDAYQGNAQFGVSVDGKQVGGTYTATASHAAGQSASVTIPGPFGAGPHSVAVTFLNDAYAGPGQDRNLYVNSVTYNGVTQAVGAALLATNASTTVPVGAATPPAAGGGGVQVPRRQPVRRRVRHPQPDRRHRQHRHLRHHLHLSHARRAGLLRRRAPERRPPAVQLGAAGAGAERPARPGATRLYRRRGALRSNKGDQRRAGPAQLRLRLRQPDWQRGDAGRLVRQAVVATGRALGPVDIKGFLSKRRMI